MVRIFSEKQIPTWDEEALAELNKIKAFKIIFIEILLKTGLIFIIYGLISLAVGVYQTIYPRTPDHTWGRLGEMIITIPIYSIPILLGAVTFFSVPHFLILWNLRIRKARDNALANLLRVYEESERIKSLEEQEKLKLKRMQEDQEEWQKQLDREIERERRLAEVRHESTIKAMQAQIKLYGEYKEKGLDIEKQVFEMRKNLIELEGQENKAMLDEVRQALDDLDT